jgi:hypothetical protein
MHPYLNSATDPLKINKKRITNALDPIYRVILSKVYPEKDKLSKNL